jgi:hypothetical protein
LLVRNSLWLLVTGISASISGTLDKRPSLDSPILVNIWVKLFEVFKDLLHVFIADFHIVLDVNEVLHIYVWLGGSHLFVSHHMPIDRVEEGVTLYFFRAFRTRS